MPLNKPLVSIIIPGFNEQDFIRDAIKSCLSQSYKDIEIIYVDDGSTDDTCNIVRNYENVQIYCQKNMGAPSARNHGLGMAAGEFIKFLDADDTLVEDAILTQVNEYYRADLGAKDIVYGDYMVIGHDGSNRPVRNKNIEGLGLRGAILNDLMTSTPLFPRSALVKVGGFDVRLRRGQEWNLHVRLALHGYRFVHMPQMIYKHRNHEGLKRISNIDLCSEEGFFKEFDRLEITLRAISDAASKQELSAMAYLFWSLGRRCLRAGNADAARKCFDYAHDVSGEFDQYWPVYYRALVQVFGTSVAERFVANAITIRRFFWRIQDLARKFIL